MPVFQFETIFRVLCFDLMSLAFLFCQIVNVSFLLSFSVSRINRELLRLLAFTYYPVDHARFGCRFSIFTIYMESLGLSVFVRSLWYGMWLLCIGLVMISLIRSPTFHLCQDPNTQRRNKRSPTKSPIWIIRDKKEENRRDQYPKATFEELQRQEINQGIKACANQQTHQQKVNFTTLQNPHHTHT